MKIIFTALLAGAALAVPAAAAPTVQFFGSDAAFTATPYFNAGNVTLQWGDGGPAGNWEVAIRGATDAVTLDQQNIDWSDNLNSITPTDNPFVRYDGTNTLAYDFDVGLDVDRSGPITVDGSFAGSSDQIVGAVNTVALRLVDVGDRTAGDGVALFAIELRTADGLIFTLDEIFADGDAEYAVITDVSIMSGFDLFIGTDGQFSEGGYFDGDPAARNARPSIQVKVGFLPFVEVPAPGALGLLGLGLAGLGAARLRRSA